MLALCPRVVRSAGRLAEASGRAREGPRGWGSARKQFGWEHPGRLRVQQCAHPPGVAQRPGASADPAHLADWPPQPRAEAPSHRVPAANGWCSNRARGLASFLMQHVGPCPAQRVARRPAAVLISRRERHNRCERPPRLNRRVGPPLGPRRLDVSRRCRTWNQAGGTNIHAVPNPRPSGQ